MRQITFSKNSWHKKLVDAVFTDYGSPVILFNYILQVFSIFVSIATGIIAVGFILYSTFRGIYTMFIYGINLYDDDQLCTVSVVGCSIMAYLIVKIVRWLQNLEIPETIGEILFTKIKWKEDE